MLPKANALKADTMIFWAAVPSDFPEHAPSIGHWITDADRLAMQGRNNLNVRRNALLARGCLRALLFHVTQGKQWIFDADCLGKPSALTLEGVCGPHISLSHTQGMIACAVSQRHPIGIDVERRRRRSFSDIADYAFGPTERCYVAAGGMDAFYKIWTLREAISKATGEGFSMAIDGKDRVTSSTDALCWIDQKWNLFHEAVEPSFSVAIATQGLDNWSLASLSRIDLAAIV